MCTLSLRTVIFERTDCCDQGWVVKPSKSFREANLLTSPQFHGLRMAERVRLFGRWRMERGFQKFSGTGLHTWTVCGRIDRSLLGVP